MIKFGSRKIQSVGLDIGTHSVKVTAMDSTDSGNLLTAYNIKNIPPGSKTSDLADIIRSTMSELDLRPEDVNLGFSGPGVIVRFVDLPRMTRDQLEGALSFEAEKYIPFNVNDVVMDFIILGDSLEKGKMRVLLAAAKKDLVQERLELMRSLNMDINVLDIDSLAVFNAFLATNDQNVEENSAFFHFGHSQGDVLVATGETPAFIRQIQIGGKDIAAGIEKDEGASDDPLPLLLDKVPQKFDESVTGLSTTSSILDDIARELQLSFGYFENRYNTKIKQVYCSGGMSFKDNILKYLNERTDIEMKGWNPLEKIDLAEHIAAEDINKVARLLTVSVGLALRS
jgi:type IV pilus assembly protein PilM